MGESVKIGWDSITFGATWVVRRRFRLGALAAVLIGGFSAMTAVEAAPGAEAPVTISGLLTREGVECQALRTDGGELFTLVGDLKGFRAGQRVRVTGQRLELSTCQQGITLRVSNIVSMT